MKKEIKYYVICGIIFLIMIAISEIARHAPDGPFPTSSEAGFQVMMGGLFGLCLDAIAIIIIVRMMKLTRMKMGGESCIVFGDEFNLDSFFYFLNDCIQGKNLYKK